MTRTHEPPFDDAGKNNQNDDAELERSMWTLLADHADGERSKMVPLGRLACKRLPAQKKQVVDIIARWRNTGLVRSYRSDTNVRLTTAGLECPDPTDADAPADD